jgi:hypothetical protein
LLVTGQNRYGPAAHERRRRESPRERTLAQARQLTKVEEGLEILYLVVDTLVIIDPHPIRRAPSPPRRELFARPVARGGDD